MPRHWIRGWLSKPVKAHYGDCWERVWVGERSDGSVFWNVIAVDTSQGKIITPHRKQMARYYIQKWLLAPHDAKSVGCFGMAITEACIFVRRDIASMGIS